MASKIENQPPIDEELAEKVKIMLEEFAPYRDDPRDRTIHTDLFNIWLALTTRPIDDLLRIEARRIALTLKTEAESENQG